MRNIKLIISYDGNNYLGWQKTPIGLTIEGSLEKALSQILQEPVLLQAASRTDAGVHAKGQVVNFFLSKDDIDLNKLQKGLNGLIGKEISILSMEEAPMDFHPTLDNEGKEYLYFICNSPHQSPFHKEYSWHYPPKIDILQMQEAALLFEGTKDFSTFCNMRATYTGSTLCHIEKITIQPQENHRLCISIKGTRFLYKMVRNIVGTLAYAGSGKIPLSAIPTIIENGNRPEAGMTAPAHGLFLNQIFYPDISDKKKELTEVGRE